MTHHTIEIRTRDGKIVSFTCGEEEPLIAAAEEAGIALPALCREGLCGACVVTCDEGDYRLGAHTQAALRPDAAERRDVLPCRTYPRSDLSLLAPYDYEHIRFAKAESRNAEIVEVTPVARSTLRLMLQLVPDGDGRRGVEFEPGQFMELTIPGRETSRPYSLANLPNGEGWLEFIIRLQPGGHFSAWLEQEARSGQTLAVRGPFGTFGLQAQSLRPRCFVAGGAGVAPFLSMLRHMAGRRDFQETRLYFGVSEEDELFYLAELERLSGVLPQLKVELCVWRPGSRWRGFRGTPVDAWLRDLGQQASSPDLYLCGPPGLIDAATDVARSFGIPDERILSERFLPAC